MAIQLEKGSLPHYLSEDSQAQRVSWRGDLLSTCTCFILPFSLFSSEGNVNLLYQVDVEEFP